MNVVEHLPAASHYGEAVAMDLELAEAADREDTPSDGSAGPPQLPVSQNTIEVQLLLRLVSLLQAQLQQRSKKRIPFPPLPRVRTAREVIRERRRDRNRGRLSTLVQQAQARWAAQQEQPDRDTETAAAVTQLVEHDPA